MFVLGLTGGIASGKSAISSMLMEMGFPVVDADIIARRVVEKGMPALEKIKMEFGDDVINPDGTLNRKALGQKAFASREKLERLNGITHPYVIDEMKKDIKVLTDKGENLCVLDVPLLFESGINSMTDKVMLVYADRETQLKRLMSRDKIDKNLAKRKISSQMSFEEKRKRSDYVVDNSGSLENTRLQLESTMALIIRGLEESNV